MKLALLIPVFAATVAITGCVTVNKSVLSRAHVTERIAKEDVHVYLPNDTVPAHERIAIMHARGDQSATNEAELIDKLREEAGKLGANAIVLGEIHEANTVTRVAAVVFGTPAERRGQALAIYVPSLRRTQ